MRNFIGGLAIIAILIGVGCFAAGWIRFQNTSDSAVMEIKTQQMKDAANKAIEQGKEMVDKATQPAPTTIADPVPNSAITP